MLDAFLFDLDGTIWDSEGTIVKTILQAASEAEVKISENEILTQFKNSISPMGVLRSYNIPVDLFWKNYKGNYMSINLFFTNTSEVFETLLGRGKIIGFITSLKKEFASTLLEKFGLLKFSKVFITPSECRTPKPSPTPLNMAIDRLSIKNVQAVYIGDQNSDIVASKRAGCKSGLAKWGARYSIDNAPDYVFENLGDILSLSKEG